MDRLFNLVPDLLSDNGCFYLVTIAENKPGLSDRIYLTLKTVKLGSFTENIDCPGRKLDLLAVVILGNSMVCSRACYINTTNDTVLLEIISAILLEFEKTRKRITSINSTCVLIPNT